MEEDVCTITALDTGSMGCMESMKRERHGKYLYLLAF